MHRIAQSCVLFLWIHTLAFVKSQNSYCTLESFLKSDRYDQHFDTTTLEDIYPSGRQVTVGCVDGHSEFFKMTCVNGRWEYRGTNCQPVKCTVPDIDNGYVPGGSHAQVVYNEHEILHFACNDLYKRAEDRPSKCTQIGDKAEFSPTPACVPTKCKLDQMTPAGTTYAPAYRNMFLPGETLTVTCGDKYYFSHFRETSAEVTCKEDGQWTRRPVCKEVICDRRDPHARFWNTWRQIKLEETTDYWCEDGYKKTSASGRAECTRDGWAPNPLCEVIPGNCRPPPEVENAVAVSSQQEEYLPRSHVTYRCHDNYTMEGGNTLQCNNGKWEKNFTCTRGCEAPPFLEDGDIKYTIKSQYSHNETVEYQCQAYYTMEGEPYRTCISGEWTGYMRCLKPCAVDEDDFRQHNITLKSRDKRYFNHDEMMEFRCARGRPVGAVAMHQRCNSGVIHLPTCQ